MYKPKSPDGKACTDLIATISVSRGAVLMRSVFSCPKPATTSHARWGMNSVTGACDYTDWRIVLHDDGNACTVGTVRGRNAKAAHLYANIQKMRMTVSASVIHWHVTRQEDDGTECDDGNLCTFNDRC